MSTNKKWLFALNLLIFFEKRLVNFDKWSKWHLDLFFSQNSKNYRNYPPQKNFFKKIIENLLQSKKTTSAYHFHDQFDIQKWKLTKFQMLDVEIYVLVFRRRVVLKWVGRFTLSIKDFYSKCDQIRSKLRIWPYLLKKSLMKNFIFFVLIQVI